MHPIHILATLEGGYNVKALVNSITNVIEAMAGAPMSFSEDFFIENPEVVN